jgi:thiol:disulfide interchange protein
VLLYGDNTRKNELVEKWLAKYQRAGVPFYIYFAPGADQGVVLPELISPSTITDLIK